MTPTSRFPRAAIVRHLQAAADELYFWSKYYDGLASRAMTASAEGQWSDRGATLAEAHRLVEEAANFLADLPRLRTTD